MSVRYRQWCLGVALLVSPAGLAGASTDSTDPLVVETEAGAVRGVATSRTLEWRGIPYVAAPVGELRWQPPRPAPPWSGIREAREFGPHCPQLGPDGVDGEEDCIYLNVFTPTSRGAQPLPVMVHLHGGSNSGFWAYRDAAALVEHDVIVVTIEYRLGVLGFVGHPELSAEGGGHSGEYGVLDQIAALEWVHDNIAAFGGDPDNVTLFGESAGSFDAAALIVSPLSRDLVHRAALQTESFWALHDVDSIAEAEDIGRDVASAVGCSQASDPAGCLRLTPVEDLVEAAGPLDVAPWSGGAVLPAAPIELMEQEPLTIPLLIGSNREEAAFFFAEVFEDTPYPSEYYQRDTDDLAGAAVGDAVRALYPADAYDSALWAAVGGVHRCGLHMSHAPARPRRRRPGVALPLHPSPRRRPVPRRPARAHTSSTNRFSGPTRSCSTASTRPTTSSPPATPRCRLRWRRTGPTSRGPAIRTAPPCRRGRSSTPAANVSWSWLIRS